ncbi:TonB-dependent receptor [Flavivirga abyssicola]|uniref:SusC/RagA family TonB-linked outer membrane protein n=1 Tax=Flavivirga abyssicola TaxID=3063533 RepID=UPI002ED6BE2A|nr:TonB-dependent receptor [Flavivirga sp. MEBiC07777]
MEDCLSPINFTYEFTENKTVVVKRKPQSIVNKQLIQTLNSNLQLQLSGLVTDDKGAPLPGASVIVKGTQNGTQTDFDGKFSLEVNSEDVVLVVSYIGFLTQEVSVNQQTNLSIILKENASELEEVVIIGFGTTTKAKAVGAVTSVKGERLEQTPFNNASEALQGQVSGLVVNRQGGAPGDIPRISIRGGETPLFVIDGVIRDEFTFATINPEDIESISFLKDAVSTAVYGTRAGDGIILVKTKRGANNKLKLRYSTNYQLSEPTVLPKKMNSLQFAQLNNDAARYDGIDPIFTQEEINIIRSGEDQVRYPNTDWQELAFRDYTAMRRHNISLNGGGDRTNYFLSLGYLDQDGILKSNAITLERYNIRSNISTTFENLGLNVSLNIDASLQKERNPSIGGNTIFRQISYLTSPLEPVFNPDGTYAAGSNPLARADRGSGYVRERDKYINTQLNIKWEVPGVEGLTAGVMGSYRESDEFNKTWSLTVPRYNPAGDVANSLPPSLNQSARYNSILDLEASLSYKSTFGMHHGIDATAVYVQREGVNENFSASRINYESSAVDQLFAGPSEGQNNSGSASENAFAGVVGRVKYDYDSTYILEFSGRYDGNDNFASGKKWGFFPAIGGAWVISNEKFMESLSEKNILNNLKFRFSFGETGIVQGVNRFGYLSTYSLEPNVINIGNTLINGYSEGNLVSPNELTWFTRKSNNIGLDFSSLNYELEGSIDYFLYNTTGFLVSPEDRYSAPLGKNLPQIKSDSEQRRAGWEFSLRYKKKLTEDFYFEIGGNMSYFDQIWVKKVDEDEASLKNPYVRETHQKDFFRRMYLSDGYYQDEFLLLNTPRPSNDSNIQLGDLRYIDSNGDGKIDDDDRRRIGKPSFPHLNYGFNFSTRYKAWSFSGLIQGTGDRYIDLGLRSEIPKELLLEYQLDYWSPENPNARFQRISTVFDNPNGLDSDHKLFNAKYVRVKNLQIGYDFKKGVLKNLKGISGLRLSLTGTNLFTISDVNDYFDPESWTARSNNFDGNVTGSTYPIQRTYTLGLNVEF